MDYGPLFIQAGLDRNSGVVYGALLERGASGVAAICRETGLHRPSAYRTLRRLEEAGLLEKRTKGKRILYGAAAPSRFEAMLSEARDATDRALGAMGTAFASQACDASVRIFRGKEGLAAVLDDVVATLKSGGVFRRFSSRDPGKDAEVFVPQDYRERRDRKHIEQFVIVSQALRETKYRKRLDCSGKFVPRKEDPFDYGVNILIYGDKVAIVDFDSETAWVIENPRVARLHASIFQLLYNRLKE